MAESALGTFRIDNDLWTKFKELAKGGDTNASKLIVGFIEACVDNRIDIKDYCHTKPKPKLENLSESIDDYLDINLDNLIDRNLDNRIDEYLKKNLDSHLGVCLDKSNLQKMVNESIEVALEPIETEVAKLKKPLAIG